MTFDDSLAGVEGSGIEFIRSNRSVDSKVHPAGDDQDSIPAVYLGPAEYGQDPGRAVAVFEVEAADGCLHNMAVVWTLQDGLILDEIRFHDVLTYPDCFADPPNGWWSGLSLPSASDDVVTGVMRTRKGQEIDVRNGSPLLEEIVQNAFDRFDVGGLPEPQFDAVVFQPSRSCVGRSRRLIQAGDVRELYVCLFESELCPSFGACQEPKAATRLSVLHELAHAWILDQVDKDLQNEFVEYVGLESWIDETLPWAEQGVEYSAEVIAWGLMDDPIRMVCG